MKYIWAVSKSGLVPPIKHLVNKETAKTFVLEDSTIVRKETMENLYQIFHKTETEADETYYHLRKVYGFEEDVVCASNMEVVQNTNLAKMPKVLLDMIHELCEDGLPTEETIKAWLLTKPGDWHGDTGE